MNRLHTYFDNKKSGLLLYGLTPPKSRNTVSKNQAITKTRINRINNVNIDSLVIYDIQDENSRNDNTRPFPFLPTLNPVDYSNNFLNQLDLPKILYLCVGKYQKPKLKKWIESEAKKNIVFVGSASKNELVKTSLKEAYSLVDTSKNLSLGGVIIAERHSQKLDEQKRIKKKQDNGCEFFISQCVFDSNNFKNLLSDLYYFYKDNDLKIPYIIFTLTPCGSLETLNLLKWLGIDIPKWIENDLLHSVDTLSKSLDMCTKVAEEITNFCLERNIPIGCCIESVAIKRDEVLASFELVNRVEKLFIKKGLR